MINNDDGTSKNMFGISVGNERIDIRSNDGEVEVRDFNGQFRKVQSRTILSVAVPTVDFDILNGYLAGDIICHPTTGVTRFCISNTAGAAVWKQITIDLSDLARLGTKNTYLASQTVTPQIIDSTSGVVTWDLDVEQSARLWTTESITSWIILNGAAGRFVTIRLSVTSNHDAIWTPTIFKTMDGFTMPGAGQFSQVNFCCFSATQLEFCGQSPLATEWST